jgi:hypothetical protein
MSTEDEIGEAANNIAEPFKEVVAVSGDTKIAPAHGIAAIALSMALKYHDMNMVKDGTLYQQYKIEGRNLKTIGLEDVFDTAIRMEVYLLGASDRIAKLVVDALAVATEDEPKAGTANAEPT